MKSRFKKRKELNHEMVLQITSMADIFTILLVFLLKSMSSGVSTITPTGNISLPSAQKTDPIIDTLKLEIGQNIILMDEKPVSNLQAFQFDPLDLDSNGLPKTLSAALMKQRQKDTLQRNPRMLILADQSTPFATLRRVLASASESGFSDYKLVVVEEQ